MKVGLYFGTYNPIHNGHLAIAKYMAEHAGLDEIWFVVSPQNPFKTNKKLLDDYQRLEMVSRAIEDDSRFQASKIEFNLPRPSYTVNTLAHLRKEYPTYGFQLIMGSDNLVLLPKWRDAESILASHKVLVYPRPGFNAETFQARPGIQLAHAPLMEISSTDIRAAIAEGKDVSHLMPPKAWQYLKEMNFYR
jgi:nicotinate-nucleotide adenylyltransferase